MSGFLSPHGHNLSVNQRRGVVAKFSVQLSVSSSIMQHHYMDGKRIGSSCHTSHRCWET